MHDEANIFEPGAGQIQVAFSEVVEGAKLVWHWQVLFTMIKVGRHCTQLLL
jgi:hypothetical protein